MTFSSGLSAYQNAIKIDESLKESGATDLAVALAKEEEVLTEFYRTHILTKSELDKYMKELLSLLEGNITIIAITPQFIIPVKIEFNIFKFNNK